MGPNIRTSVAVDAVSHNAALGQQLAPADEGPTFSNPGKYEIPAGGWNGKGYYGPSLMSSREASAQTLINGSVSIMGPPAAGERGRTSLSFAKYLREPDEIEIDPFKETMLLYAAARLDGDDEHYVGNPEWSIAELVFLDGAEAR